MPEETTESRHLHERIDKVLQTLAKDTAETAQLNAMLRAFIGEQRAMNAKIDREKDDHEKRLRVIEAWKAGIERTLPNRIADAEDIDDRFDRLDRQLDVQNERIAKINQTLAKWAGAIAVGVFVIEAVIVPVAKFTWVWATGS